MTLYLISHFIQVWLLPPGIFLLICLIGFILGWQKQLGRIMIILAFISLWLLSTPFVARYLILPLEQQYPMLISFSTISPDDAHAAIVVLSGGDRFAPEESSLVLNGPSLQRLHYAIYLYQKTHWQIIPSGGGPKDTTYNDASLMRLELSKQNIPTKWEENQSVTTLDEAKFILPILIKQHIKNIYLVTNAYHMPRSMYIFNKLLKNNNINIIPAPMGYMSTWPNNDITFYLPDINGLMLSAVALHEYVGLAWYWLYSKKEASWKEES